MQIDNRTVELPPDQPQPERGQILLVTRGCLTCGAPEETPDGKQIYWPKDYPMPAVRCSRCGSNNMMVNDYVFAYYRREPHINWRDSPRGRHGNGCTCPRHSLPTDD